MCMPLLLWDRTGLSKVYVKCQIIDILGFFRANGKTKYRRQKSISEILDIIIVEYIFHTEILKSESFEGRTILLN